jgi:hypothetical protein
MAMPEAAPLDLLQAGSACRELSQVGVEFLHFVERHPEALSRSSFALLDEDRPFFRRIQSWPTFLDADRSAAMAQANMALFQLVRSLPRRFFGGDPLRLSQFYGLSRDQASILSGIMEDPAVLDTVVGRADFILGPKGFECLELNVSPALGGWSNTIWAELFPKIPLIAKFLAEYEVDYTVTDTVRILYRHLCVQASSKLAPFEKEMNVAFIVESRAPALALKPRLDHVLAEVLAEIDPALSGEVHFCNYGDLSRRPSGMYLGTKRMRVVLEKDQPTTPDAFGCWMSGQVDLYNGAIDRVLTDKRNLALLSEHEDSPALTPVERRLVREYIPWTRVLAPGEHRFRGERVVFPDFLLAQRGGFVLKPVSGLAGTGVVIGAHETLDDWERALGAALATGGYLIQERVESFPFYYQGGDHGCEPHEVVWGHFAFGDEYGGVHLRMLPSSRKGVVNVGRGAVSGPVFLVGAPMRRAEPAGMGEPGSV